MKLPNQSDSKKLWRTVKSLLHTSKSDSDIVTGLCHSFVLHMKQKIDNVMKTVSTYSRQITCNALNSNRLHTGPPLITLAPTCDAEVLKYIAKLPNKSSPLDYINTSVLKSCAEVFAPLITHLVNLSFSEGCYPSQFKQAQVIHAQEAWT